MPWRLFAVVVLMNFPDLAKLLEERVAVIADHEFRDRDPEAHLEALKSVSGESLPGMKHTGVRLMEIWTTS